MMQYWCPMSNKSLQIFEPELYKTTHIHFFGHEQIRETCTDTHKYTHTYKHIHTHTQNIFLSESVTQTRLKILPTLCVTEYNIKK